MTDDEKHRRHRRRATGLTMPVAAINLTVALVNHHYGVWWWWWTNLVAAGALLGLALSATDRQRGR